MRLRRTVVLFAALTVGACAGLKNVMALAQALQARYHLPANVNISNERHLTITFQNVDASMKMDSASRADFAHDVATFAKAHYADARKLDDISIGFATVSSTGPLTMTKSDAQYSFRTDELP